MSTIRSATAILTEIRDGRAILELSEHIHDGLAAVLEHGKPAKVNLEITIALAKTGQHRLTEPTLILTAEVSSKLPKPDLEATIFFVDQDQNPSRQPGERQAGLGLQIAGSTGTHNE